MTLDEGLDRGKLDLVVFADHLGRQIAGQRHPATRAFIGMVVDDVIDVLAQAARMPLVARLGAARLGLLAALFPIGRGRLRRRARCLRRALQPQHQLDQLVFAQSLKIESAHSQRESAIALRGKGVGIYGAWPAEQINLSLVIAEKIYLAIFPEILRDEAWRSACEHARPPAGLS